MRRFPYEVELFGQMSREFCDHFAGLEAPPVGPEALDEARGGVHERKVFRDHRHHSRPQDLDRRLSASGEYGEMHLGDRRARDGLQLEFLENFRDRLAERALDLGHRELAGKRRYPVLELRQLVGEVGGQEVAARREHLAELDENGPERFERQAQPRAARLAERAKEKERVQRAREAAPRSKRELVQPEAQGYPEDLSETKQGNGRPRGEAANLPELAVATRKRDRLFSGTCSGPTGAVCVFRAGLRRRAASRRCRKSSPRRRAARAGAAPRSSIRRGFRRGAMRRRAATPRGLCRWKRGGGRRCRRTLWRDLPRNPR